MKTGSKKSTAVRIAGITVTLAALAGILAYSGNGSLAGDATLGTKVFIAVAAAVLVLQVIPGVMLMAGIFKGVRSVVGRRELLIAERESSYRSGMADFFRKAGYRVETAETAEQVVDTVSGMLAPVLLLGSDFSRKLPSPDLIHLFKKCNRNLHIIMVSDQMSLAQARQVREEGIFYHALKPVSPDDTEELGQVVECAFQHQASAHGNPAAALKQRQAQESDEQVTRRAQLAQALPWAVASMVAVLAATSYAKIASWVSSLCQGMSLSTWIFLGFCALVVTYQMLPIFRIKLKRRREQAAREAKEGPQAG